MKKYLAIDIGGTFIKYSVMEEDYRILEEGSISTKKEPKQFLEQLTSLAVEYKEKVEGIAVCIAGFINPETGENTDFSVGEHFRTYNLKEELEKVSGHAVTIENDSNCAALGEMVAGAGRNYKDICLLTIGTGIGGAIVMGGNLWRGSHFKAGEAGLMQIGGENSEYAGATSVLVRRVSQAIGKTIDGPYVFEHLSEPEVAMIYKDWLEKLSVVVGNMTMLVDPQVMLIGGGICHEPRFIRDLKAKVYEMYPHLSEYTEIKGCETGNQAGRIGALALHKEEIV